MLKPKSIITLVLAGLLTALSALFVAGERIAWSAPTAVATPGPLRFVPVDALAPPAAPALSAGYANAASGANRRATPRFASFA